MQVGECGPDQKTGGGAGDGDTWYSGVRNEDAEGMERSRRMISCGNSSKKLVKAERDTRVSQEHCTLSYTEVRLYTILQYFSFFLVYLSFLLLHIDLFQYFLPYTATFPSVLLC